MTSSFNFRLRLYFGHYFNNFKNIRMSSIEFAVKFTVKRFTAICGQRKENEHSAHISGGNRLPNII